MNPHHPDAHIKGSSLRPDRFIFGDALDAQGLTSCTYLVHTETPAFVCRWQMQDDKPFEGSDSDALSSALLFDENKQRSIYVCNQGIRLFDFNFMPSSTPRAIDLQRICDEAISTYLRLQKLDQQRNTMDAVREMRIFSTKPLPPAARAQAVAKLEKLAMDADQPMNKLRLMAQLQQDMGGGDPAVLTETQLALLSAPAARKSLLQAARECIAFPEVVRKDGSILSFELWALPFAFSRMQGGIWWHFPMLERIEPILAKALELPAKSLLWVSPTWFTCDMLYERSCQDLIHLAHVMDAGCDYAPVEHTNARASYEAARQAQDPKLVLAFIPFLIERGALSQSQATRRGRKALDAVLPIVKESIATEMEYVEAELFGPQPWWPAIHSAVQSVNRKRLGIALALAAVHLGGIQGLLAEAEYLPESQCYEIILYQRQDSAPLGRFTWLLAPDVATDRERALDDLAVCLREVGLPFHEKVPRLH